MVDKVIENNRVSIVGEIVSDFRYSHQVYGEGFYIVDVAVSRLSELSDVIPLMVSERLVDVTESCIGRLVETSGQFRSYNRHEGVKNKLILSIFVREMQFIVESGGWKDEPDLSGRLHLQRACLQENTAWKGDCRFADRSQPSIWKE